MRHAGRIIVLDHIRAIAAPEAVEVVAGPTVQCVRARSAFKRVIPVPAFQRVVIRTAIQPVISAVAREPVLTRKPADRIGQSGALNYLRRRRTDEDRRNQGIRVQHSAVGKAQFLYRAVGRILEVIPQRHAVSGSNNAHHQVIASPRPAQVSLHHPGLQFQHVPLHRGRIICRNHIRAVAAPEAVSVVASPSVEGVSTRPAIQRVVSIPTFQRVIIRPAIQPVIATVTREQVRPFKPAHRIGQHGALKRICRPRADEDRWRKHIGIQHGAVGKAYLLYWAVGRITEVIAQRHAVRRSEDTQHQIIPNPCTAHVGLFQVP